MECRRGYAAKYTLPRMGGLAQFLASRRLTCPHARCYPWPQNRRLEIATSSALGFMTTPPILRSPSGGHPGDSCGIRHQAVARRRIARRLRFLRTQPREKERSDLPGVLFAFDVGKRISRIEMTDRSRSMLPGGRAFGRSKLMVFDAVFGPFGKPELLASRPANVPACHLGCYRFASIGTSAVPCAARTVLLETTPHSRT